MSKRDARVHPGFIGPNTALVMIVLAFGPSLLLGQNPSALPNPTDGQRLFGENCAGCHGADARGTDKSPALSGNRNMSSRSVRQLHELIKIGIPGTGMPAFDLPDKDLEALAEFLHSMHWQAAGTNLPGDPAAGEMFFFGKGKCGACHMVSSKGSPIGPDLSDLGNDMTVEEIQSAFKEPSAHITPGYEMVSVTTRDGKTVRGFARNRNNFDIRVQDLQGKFHLIEEGQIASIHEEKASAMPAVRASPQEMQDLIAYLSHLTGVKTGALAAPLSSCRGRHRLCTNSSSQARRLVELRREGEREPVQRLDSDQHYQC